MRIQPLETVSSLLMLVLVSGCASLPSMDGRSPISIGAHKFVTALPEDNRLTAQSDSTVDRLEVGQYCRFVFTELPPKFENTSGVVFEELPSDLTLQVQMGGRVVAIDDARMTLDEAVDITDPWSISPIELMLSPTKLFSKPKKIMITPFGGVTTGEMRVPLSKISQVESMDRASWVAFCQSAYQKPVPMDSTLNLRPER